VTNEKIQILLTNDDGIDSPGLWAAAEALSEVGYVWVAAPREQSSGMGRSMPPTSDGRITLKQLTVHGKQWTIYAVGGTPAQTVQHAILEIMPSYPDLVVSGINYGSNLATGVTVSGTIGAAIEGASHNVPSLAVSLDTHHQYHLSHSKDVDFSAAAHFTKLFAQFYLKNKFDPDVQLIKIEVPAGATSQTPWEIARLSPLRFYHPVKPERESWEEPKSTGYAIADDLERFPHDSDVYVMLKKEHVAVTPLSLDMTSRVDLKKLEEKLRANAS
jgi:5'-nucleotidase